MPTKPIGPARATAAPVASEALTNAQRCVRATSTPRDAARSAPTLSRFSDDGSMAKPANAASSSGSAARIGSKPPTSRSPISHRDGAIHLGEVGQVLHEQDQRREERVQRHARQQQHGGRHRAARRRGQPVDERRRGAGAGQAGERHRRPRSHRREAAEDDDEHRPERRAGRDAQRERRGQRVAQQRLEHHAGDGQRRADQRAREHARQPRDEEDLRVDVVLERNRPIERPAEV